MNDTIVLSTNNHLGDVVICTAVLHNLKLALPEINFVFDSNYNGVFEKNPYILRDVTSSGFVGKLKLEYAPFSQRAGDGGTCIAGFTESVSRRLFFHLNRNVPLVFTKPEFYFDMEENKFGDYWIINAGWQTCSETKAYPWYQEIVNLRNDIKFIQIGGKEERDVNAPLNNVVDLRGKTSIKELVSLVSHANGIISPPSAIVHISGAFPSVKSIVISGAREPEVLTKYDNTIHLTSECEGYNGKNGCMKFFTRNIDNRTCRKVSNINGNKYPECMCKIEPKKVAYWLSHDMK